MSSQTSIREKLDNIVSRTSAKVLPQLQKAEKGIKVVNFQMAPWEETNIKLIDMTKNSKQRYLKFPLIAVVEPFIQAKVDRFTEITLQVYICHHTSKNFDSAARDGRVFDPIIHPIQDEFLRQLALSKYFFGSVASAIQYTQIDNKYAGKEDIFKAEGVPFAEFIDFVALRDLKLYLKPSVC